MDKVTVKVMSHSCKMADITDQGVSCKHQIRFCFCIFGWSFLFNMFFLLHSILAECKLFYSMFHNRRVPSQCLNCIFYLSSINLWSLSFWINACHRQWAMGQLALPLPIIKARSWVKKSRPIWFVFNHLPIKK